MRLAPHVRLAEVAGDLVFLDLRANAYLCLPRPAAEVRDALTGPGTGRGSGLAAELEAAGLLSPAGTPWRGNPAATAVADLGPIERVRSAPGDRRRLLWAALGTARRLRRSPLAWARERARHRLPSAPADAVRALALRFHRLSPWLPASGRCLANSMLLLDFLAASGAGADWVFGVRTHPFEAHCWVEADGVVLNDGLDHVRWYTPILRL